MDGPTDSAAAKEVKQARLVALVTGNAEDIAPSGILAVPLTAVQQTTASVLFSIRSERTSGS